MQRSTFLRQAEEEIFDLCIIGGGATGAGCAVDAALRGLKVILVEQNDFTSSTSSKSTKLIHGGVRYLEQAVKKLSLDQFKMVKKGLKERKTLLELAPFLTRPVSLVTPVKNIFAGLYYYFGLKVYDMLSGNQSLGASKWLSKTEALKKISTLKQNFACAIMYYDGQLDDQRYGMALVQTASQLGATVLNHIKVTEFKKDSKGEITSLFAQNMLDASTLNIKAKCFINATGPFSDHVRLMANNKLKPRVIVSKGVHIILPKSIMPSTNALLIPETEDGRLVFAIPYQDNLLVGTTEDETALITEDFGPDKNEVEYILKYVNRYLTGDIQPSQVIAGFGGLRPLVQADENAATKELVRDHIIETDKASKLISVLGGKWTTYRLMAKDTIDICEQQLNNNITPCNTDTQVLYGGKIPTAQLHENIKTIVSFSEVIINHIVNKYGDNAVAIAQLAAGSEKLCNKIIENAPYTYAELHYVLENEMACTVKDVVNGRFGTQLLNWKLTLNLIQPVGNYMATYFGWTALQQEENINNYEAELQKMINASINN